MSKDLSVWDFNDVQTWLPSIRMDRYSSSFKSHQVNGYDLCYLSNSDFNDLSISDFHDKNIIMKSIRALTLDELKIKIGYDNKFVTVQLDFDPNFTVELLARELQNIFHIQNKIYIETEDHELLMPNLKIVELILLNPFKYKNIRIVNERNILFDSSPAVIRPNSSSDLNTNNLYSTNSNNKYYTNTSTTNSTTNLNNNNNNYAPILNRSASAFPIYKNDNNNFNTKLNQLQDQSPLTSNKTPTNNNINLNKDYQLYRENTTNLNHIISQSGMNNNTQNMNNSFLKSNSTEYNFKYNLNEVDSGNNKCSQYSYSNKNEDGKYTPKDSTSYNNKSDFSLQKDSYGNMTPNYRKENNYPQVKSNTSNDYFNLNNMRRASENNNGNKESTNYDSYLEINRLNEKKDGRKYSSEKRSYRQNELGEGNDLTKYSLYSNNILDKTPPYGGGNVNTKYSSYSQSAMNSNSNMNIDNNMMMKNKSMIPRPSQN